MPPKCKFEKEEIVKAALDLVREKGFPALTARALGERLGTSARPIFSLFQSMGEVQSAVTAAAGDLFEAFTAREIKSGKYPEYKAIGMAYIRFAEEEKELFKLLYMRDRTAEPSTGMDDRLDGIIEIITQNTGLSREDAYLFHLEMWVCVHGIAAMIATAYLKWENETVSRMLTDIYTGLRARYSIGGTTSWMPSNA